MRRIFVVLKKELKRFFTDKRMLAALIFPGILIFLIYTLIGNFVKDEDFIQLNKEHQYRIALSNNYNNENKKEAPLFTFTLDNVLELQGIKKPIYSYYSFEDRENILNNLKEKTLDAVVVFPNNFENEIFNANPIKSNIEIYYNSEVKESELLYSMLTESLNSTYSNFTLNLGVNPNVGKKSSIGQQIMAIIFPLITISLLYSTTMTVCPEAIAGEKERGTIASILISPIKRGEYAIGKISALSIVSLFGGVISGVGVIASLPAMIGNNLSLTFPTYVLLFFVIISIVILFVNLATAVSTFAKSTKEATSYLGPLTVIFLLLALIPGILDTSHIGFSFIPILNVSQTMNSILTSNVNILFFICTLLSNFVYSGLLILLDIKLFKNEKIILRQ